jgi:hypothetical protein
LSVIEVIRREKKKNK